MQGVIEIVSSFPLVVFTVLWPLAGLYWLLVAARLAPLELLEHDSLKGDHFASTLVALGFAGVPASFALSVLVGLAGVLTLAVELALLRWLPLGLLRIPLGVAVLWAAFALASPLSASLCHALHRWFHRHAPASRRCLLGEKVVVKDAPGGDDCATAALVDDPECGVRLHGKPGAMPRVGERRVLVKYLAEEGTYRSVAEHDFREARAHLNRLRLRQRHSAGRPHNGGTPASG